MNCHSHTITDNRDASPVVPKCAYCGRSNFHREGQEWRCLNCGAYGAGPGRPGHGPGIDHDDWLQNLAQQNAALAIRRVLMELDTIEQAAAQISRFNRPP